MKKIILISIVILFASCKKQYHCICKDNQWKRKTFTEYNGLISPEKACQKNIGKLTDTGFIYECNLY